MDSKALDEPLAIKNDTRLNIEFAFDSDCFFLRRSPTETRFRPFNFKKIPPAKKKKHRKAERGEGGAPSPRGAGRIVRVTTQSERTHQSKATTHAERETSVAPRLKIGSSGAVYTHKIELTRFCDSKQSNCLHCVL